MELINVLLISKQGAREEFLVYCLKKLSYTYLLVDCNQSPNAIFEYFSSYLIECVLLPLDTSVQAQSISLAESLHYLYRVRSIFYIKTIKAAQIVLLKQFSTPIYLINPINRSNIYVTIELVRYRHLMDRMKEKKYTSEFFFIPQGNTYVRVNFKDVLFLKKEEGFWQLVLVTSTKYKIYSNLNLLVKSLPIHFVNCHNCYIINLEKILRIHPKNLVLCNETIIPLEKSYRKKVLEALSIETSAEENLPT